MTPIPLTGQALVDKALEVARTAHDGQFRANGLTPYLDHPLEVERQLLLNWGNYRTDLHMMGKEEGPDDQYRGRAIAILHDVLEPDAVHRLTIDDIIAHGFLSIAGELALLTKPEGMTYLDYVLRLRGMRRMAPLAFYTKLADFAANELTLNMVPSKSRQRNMLTKWQMAKWILLS